MRRVSWAAGSGGRGQGWHGAGRQPRVNRWPVSRGLPGVPRALTLLLPGRTPSPGGGGHKSMDDLCTQTPPPPLLTSPGHRPLTSACLASFWKALPVEGKGSGL